MSLWQFGYAGCDVFEEGDELVAYTNNGERVAAHGTTEGIINELSDWWLVQQQRRMTDDLDMKPVSE